MEIITAVILFLAGTAWGYFIKWWLVRKTASSGTMFIVPDKDRLIYSLELDEIPETLAFKKEVKFKVRAPKEMRNRE